MMQDSGEVLVLTGYHRAGMLSSFALASLCPLVRIGDKVLRLQHSDHQKESCRIKAYSGPITFAVEGVSNFRKRVINTRFFCFWTFAALTHEGAQ